MVVDREGPILVEGPVEVTTADGEVAVSERFVVAVCTCRRSRTYPWCDTSHRRREPVPDPVETADGDRPSGARGGEAGNATEHSAIEHSAIEHSTGALDAATAKDSGS